MYARNIAEFKALPDAFALRIVNDDTIQCANEDQHWLVIEELECDVYPSRCTWVGSYRQTFFKQADAPCTSKHRTSKRTATSHYENTLNDQQPPITAKVRSWVWDFEAYIDFDKKIYRITWNSKSTPDTNAAEETILYYILPVDDPDIHEYKRM
jgi:hypothetical protein